MKLVLSQKPPPRLLRSAISALPPTCAIPQAVPDVRKGFFQAHRRLLIAGILVGILVILAFVYVLMQESPMRDEAAAVRKLIGVATHKLTSSNHPSKPPAPLIVQLNSDVVQVTGIALGHPRLAVINGKQVAEGDNITVHTPTRAVTVTLRVLRIDDGRVDFSDGTQVLTAQLTVPVRTN